MLKNSLRRIKHWAARIRLRRLANRIVRQADRDERILPLVETFSTQTLLAQAEFGKLPTNVPRAENPQSIILLTQPPGPHRFTLIEATLATLLVARGHKVKVLLCDRNQPGCDLIRTEHVNRRHEICQECRGFGAKLFENLGLNTIWTSNILASLVEADTESLDFRDTVESSLMRHWKTGRLPENVDDTPEWQQFTQSAKQSYLIGRWIAAKQPDLVFMSHGIYVGWEPAFKTLLESQIPVLTHDRGRRGKTEHFHWNSPSSEWDLSDEWSRVKDAALSTEQEKKLDDYLSERREHKSEVVKYSFGDIDSLEGTLKKLLLEPERRRYVLYPNLMWDANSIKRATIFESPTEWILHTIDWFHEHPEFDLIIRVHPAEAVRGVSESVSGLVDEHYPSLPDNIRMIAADEEISSFNVQQMTDVGLVYTSTVGMEIALQGKPVGVAGRVHYAKCGFSDDFAVVSDYDDWLADPIADVQEVERRVTFARRYFYLWACRAQIPFEVFYEVGAGTPAAWKSWNLSRLWEDEAMRLVIDAIETAKPIFLPVQLTSSVSA